MRPTGTPEQLERGRWRAVELLTQGRPPVEVARDDRRESATENGSRCGTPPTRSTFCPSQQGLVDDFIEGGLGWQSNNDPAVDESRGSSVNAEVFPFLTCCLDSREGGFGVDACGES
jgi:hypothetical protein